MNKIRALIPASIAAMILATSGCSGDSYEYTISGVVEAGQVDYDCPGHLSLDTASFVVGGKKTPDSRSRTSPKPDSANRSKPPATTTPSPTRKRGSSVTGNRSATPSKVPENKGAKLSKKPDKPKRITRIPAPKHNSTLKGCKVDDYELFVRSDGTLYEQDVRRIDYHRCLSSERELFPACTKD